MDNNKQDQKMVIYGEGINCLVALQREAWRNEVFRMWSAHGSPRVSFALKLAGAAVALLGRVRCGAERGREGAAGQPCTARARDRKLGHATP